MRFLRSRVNLNKRHQSSIDFSHPVLPNACAIDILTNEDRSAYWEYGFKNCFREPQGIDFTCVWLVWLIFSQTFVFKNHTPIYCRSHGKRAWPWVWRFPKNWAANRAKNGKRVIGTTPYWLWVSVKIYGTFVTSMQVHPEIQREFVSYSIIAIFLISHSS